MDHAYDDNQPLTVGIFDRCSCGNILNGHNAEEGECCHLGNLGIVPHYKHSTPAEMEQYRNTLGHIADYKRAQILDRAAARRAKTESRGE